MHLALLPRPTCGPPRFPPQGDTIESSTFLLNARAQLRVLLFPLGDLCPSGSEEFVALYVHHVGDPGQCPEGDVNITVSADRAEFEAVSKRWSWSNNAADTVNGGGRTVPDI